MGLLGLPYFVLLNCARGPFKVFPLFLSINSYRVGPLGFLPHSLFLGPIQDSLSFLEEGHLVVADSSTLPMGQFVLSIVFLGILSL